MSGCEMWSGGDWGRDIGLEEVVIGGYEEAER